VAKHIIWNEEAVAQGAGRSTLKTSLARIGNYSEVEAVPLLVVRVRQARGAAGD
jgi:hypothetical protein